jgi:hypothetical protein
MSSIQLGPRCRRSGWPALLLEMFEHFQSLIKRGYKHRSGDRAASQVGGREYLGIDRAAGKIGDQCSSSQLDFYRSTQHAEGGCAIKIDERERQ